tara:strand:- start:443 stop:616 length:174 start_codon:yes stop_codon:yes gene_type:complete
MDKFDPAINYGPNDAGVSAISIALVVIGLIFGSWLIGKIYSFTSSSIQKLIKKDDLQ